MKILTVQFDVTNLPQEAVDQLRLAAEVQAEDILAQSGATYEATHLRSSVKEIDEDYLVS